ncbi:MAG TPA: type II secretion system F family protein [Candidatus Sulfopaludibacter sp.]|jgi:tight adherence protein C|nr:type II secretion system F family protein [Candidatus Sulfopaludibacter sp.]
MLIDILFFLVCGTTLSLLVWAGTELFRTQEDPLGDRLDELQSNALVATARVARRKATGTGMDRMLYVVSLMPGGEDWIHGSERLLRQAGIRRKGAVGIYVLLALAFLLFLVLGTLKLQDFQIGTNLIGGLVAAGILGFMLPKVVLQRMVKRYRRKLQDALPDTVDLLGIVLGTGLALDQAMMRVSEEMEYIYPELAGEFGTVVMQVRAGQERGTAFNQFVRRTGIEDIKSLAAMIIQSEKFGTSLSVALKVYAEGLRKRRTLKAEEAVAKAGIKMLFPIVIFILPVLFVITLVPGLLSVLKDLKTLGGGR